MFRFWTGRWHHMWNLCHYYHHSPLSLYKTHTLRALIAVLGWVCPKMMTAAKCCRCSHAMMSAASLLRHIPTRLLCSMICQYTLHIAVCIFYTTTTYHALFHSLAHISCRVCAFGILALALAPSKGSSCLLEGNFRPGHPVMAMYYN